MSDATIQRRHRRGGPHVVTGLKRRQNHPIQGADEGQWGSFLYKLDKYLRIKEEGTTRRYCAVVDEAAAGATGAVASAGAAAAAAAAAGASRLTLLYPMLHRLEIRPQSEQAHVHAKADQAVDRRAGQHKAGPALQHVKKRHPTKNTEHVGRSTTLLKVLLPGPAQNQAAKRRPNAHTGDVLLHSQAHGKRTGPTIMHPNAKNTHRWDCWRQGSLCCCRTGRSIGGSTSTPTGLAGYRDCKAIDVVKQAPNCRERESIKSGGGRAPANFIA